MKDHVCSQCHENFPITSSVRVWNSPKYLFYPFHGPRTQLKMFSLVRCPNCGHEESDPSIKFLGIFPPIGILWLLLAFLVLAVLEAVFNGK